jgi:hypothetical protein
MPIRSRGALVIPPRREQRLADALDHVVQALALLAVLAAALFFRCV